MDFDSLAQPVAILANEIEVSILSLCMDEDDIPYNIELGDSSIESVYLGSGAKYLTGCYARVWCLPEDRDFVLSLLAQIRQSDNELPIAEGDEYDNMYLDDEFDDEDDIDNFSDIDDTDDIDDVEEDYFSADDEFTGVDELADK